MLLFSLICMYIKLSSSQFGFPGRGHMGHNHMQPMIPQLTADRICNNPNGCTFMCTTNNQCVGPYVCGSKSGRCTFICEHDACQDATFISLSKGHTQFNCLGEYSCEQTHMYCGSVPPHYAGLIGAVTPGSTANATCNFVCRKNACRHNLMRCDGVGRCAFRAQNALGSGGNALEDSEIICNMHRPTDKCSVFCGGAMYGNYEPQCERSVLNCMKGRCPCTGGPCGTGLMIHGNAHRQINNNPRLNPVQHQQQQQQYHNNMHNQPNQPNQPNPYQNRPNYNQGNLPYQNPNQYGQRSNFINNQMSSTVRCHEPPLCANKITTCLRQNCKFECQEPGSCTNAIFKTSLTTQVLEVQCDKAGSCNGIRVISTAATTKIKCHDYACIGIDITCNSFRGEICELECGSDGCRSEYMSNQMPHNHMPHNQNPYNQNPNLYGNRIPNNQIANTGNKVSCLGYYQNCLVKARGEFSFINGNFTCAMTAGSCLLECSDNQGEISCRGAKYLCNSLNPNICKCHDIRQNRFYSRMQFQNSMYDCPHITFPRPQFIPPIKIVTKIIKTTRKVITKKSITKKTTTKITKPVVKGP